MHLILYPQADLNTVVLDNHVEQKDEWIKIRVNFEGIFRHRIDRVGVVITGCEFALRRDEDGWDRLLRDVPEKVVEQALEWLEELKAFADERRPGLRV